MLEIDGREVRITNPDKVVFPEPGLTKLDLVQLLPRASPTAPCAASTGRPMVLKRFVKGISQEAFFQKRAPEKRPDWIETATLHYASGNSAEEVVVRDAAALAWVVNLGCIDLNPHPVRADDLEHPDELRVDLDPMPGRRLEPDRRRRHGRARGAHRPRARRLAEDLGLTGHPHLRAHRADAGTSARCGTPPRRSPARSSCGRPGSRRRAGGRRSAARACSSTSTRTRRTARSRRRTRSGRCPTRACRRRSTGARCATAGPSGSRCATMLERFAERGDPAAGIDDAVGGLDGLLALAEQLGPAEKPPRASGAGGDGARRRRAPAVDDAAHRDRPREDQARGARGTRALEGPPPRGRRRCCSRPTCSSTACAAARRSGTASA